ncbi:peptide ligase PGM1-related protein [Streptomyces niveus]|uniref:peptide ligase PGM1-related protein n=1 Tax=Streptomyces niveus TaxID=193462 RepID=UPI0036D27817
MGGNYLTDRILVEQRRCTFPAFTTAVRILAESGLAYDHATRTGVLLAVEDGSDAGGFGEYCVVAENAEQAERLEAALARVFTAHGK